MEDHFSITLLHLRKTALPLSKLIIPPVWICFKCTPSQFPSHYWHKNTSTQYWPQGMSIRTCRISKHWPLLFELGNPVILPQFMFNISGTWTIFGHLHTIRVEINRQKSSLWHQLIFCYLHRNDYLDYLIVEGIPGFWSRHAKCSQSLFCLSYAWIFH